MDAFLAQFANRPSASQDPSFFYSSAQAAEKPLPSRKKAFTVRLGIGDSSSSSSSSASSSSSSSSSSASESEVEVRLKKTSKSKVKPNSSSGFIVDKTGENEIDIDEFISAIQREAKIQVGKPDLDGAFCTLKPSMKVATASNATATAILETFPIRKLGFVIELVNSDEFDVTQPPVAQIKKRGRPPKGKEKENDKGTEKRNENETDPEEENDKELGVEKEKRKKQGVRVRRVPAAAVSADVDASVSAVVKRLNEMRSAPLKLTASNYYMNNRKYFTAFITETFQRLAKKNTTRTTDLEAALEEDEFNCSDLSALDKKPFSALYHQRIVREYMNAYSPYRGLLLFHGLGSGKTCSSIIIAEGLSSHKKVVVMTPASLQKNYIEEIKKCGDAMFKQDQHWVFFPLDKAPKGRTVQEHERALLQALGFPAKVAPEENIVKINSGVWFAEHGKPGNYHQLDELKKMEIDSQIDRMIRNKYRFINYNGIRREAWNELMRQSPTGNYFDDAVIIVDEAHNLVSRIVNKIKSPKSLSMSIYRAFLSANNSKVVLLTGTPIINYPNELGIMFNILRGYITTFNFTLDLSEFSGAGAGAGSNMLNTLKTMFSKAGPDDGVNVHDYLDFKQTPKPILTLTRNPFGFVSGTGTAAYSVSFKGVGGDMDDDTFCSNVTKFLERYRIRVSGPPAKTQYKALPDMLDTFNAMFIKPDGSGILNPDLFSRRIIGLTSYFRSAQEKLLPKYNPATDFITVEIEMTNHQFSLYKEIRENERKTESNSKRRKAVGASDLYGETSSTYRIFSRACCNFAFPIELPRPLQISDVAKDTDKDKDKDKDKDAPAKKNKDKRQLITEREFEGDVENDDDDEAVVAEEGGKGRLRNASSSPLSTSDLRTYGDRIKSTLEKLADNADTYLSIEALSSMYSPKFAQIYREITNTEHVGLHLLYSQFRTLEGIGIFKLVMDANGYAEFKIRKNQHDGTWSQYYQNPEDEGKPMYALYTGTEGKEEKEIIRNVFNSSWNNLPNPLKSDLASKYGSDRSRKNIYGDVIKLLMITASGAEGINLRNVRYVHIMEPYWHPVRTEQIIGRANRICSHYELPEKLRTVNVFIYVMTFTEEQLNPGKQDKPIDHIKVLDAGISTDQKLLDTSNKKQLINQQLLTVVKASAVDCNTHKSKGGLDVQCFEYKSISGKDDVAFVPDITQEQADADAQRNQVKQKGIQVNPFKYEVTKPDGSVIMKDYLLDATTNTVYEPGAANRAPIRVGTLVYAATGTRIKYD